MSKKKIMKASTTPKSQEVSAFDVDSLMDTLTASYKAKREGASRNDIVKAVPEHWLGVTREIAQIELDFQTAATKLKEATRYMAKSSDEGMAASHARNDMYDAKNKLQNEALATIPKHKQVCQIEGTYAGRGFWDVFREIKHLAGSPERLVAMLSEA